MSHKFLGTLEQLQSAICLTQISGQWRELLPGHHQFRSADGAVLNWWVSKGTLNFQGSAPAARRLQEAIAAIAALNGASIPCRALSPTK